MSVVIDGTLGITTPAETVQGALTTTGNTILGDATTDTLNVGAGGLVKDASGNVGIGTASPAFSLDVRGDGQKARFGNTTIGCTVGNYVGGTIWGFSNNAGSGGMFGDASNYIYFASAGAERMRIDSSGNVGIGTASPITKLDVSQANVKSATAAWQLSVTDLTSQTTGVGGGISFTGYKTGTTALEFFAGIDGYKENATAGNAAGALRFHTQVSGGTGLVERARIDSSGNLLVGTTSKIAGANAPLQGYTNGGSCIIAQQVASTSDNLSLWNSATANNNIFVGFYTETSITSRGTISYNRAGGLVAYNVTSDYRAKDIYGPVTDSGALIDSVPVYMGKMKDATQERPMFIAHEVPAYAHTGEKDAVDKDGNPVYQQMDASALIPVMWAEIQSLRKRLAALEA
jgi:hypothetical protein